MSLNRPVAPYFSQEKVTCHVCGNLVPKFQAFVPGWIEKLVYECVKCPTKNVDDSLVVIDESEQTKCEICHKTVLLVHCDLNSDGLDVCSECQNHEDE